MVQKPMRYQSVLRMSGWLIVRFGKTFSAIWTKTTPLRIFAFPHLAPISCAKTIDFITKLQNGNHKLDGLNVTNTFSMDELTVTEAAKEYPDAPHPRNIRRAAKLGYIEGARLVGKTWAFARENFEAWLNDPRYHTPGVKTDE
jgi:hypothetical protein